jgi:hypothetical protein
MRHVVHVLEIHTCCIKIHLYIYATDGVCGAGLDVKNTYALLNTHAYMPTHLHCIKYLAED